MERRIHICSYVAYYNQYQVNRKRMVCDLSLHTADPLHAVLWQVFHIYKHIYSDDANWKCGENWKTS